MFFFFFHSKAHNCEILKVYFKVVKFFFLKYNSNITLFEAIRPDIIIRVFKTYFILRNLNWSFHFRKVPGISF